MKPAQSFSCGCCGTAGPRWAAGVLTVAQAVERIVSLGWAVQVGASYCPRCASACDVCGGGVGATCQGCQAARLERDLRASVKRGSPLLSSVALLLRPEVVS